MSTKAGPFGPLTARIGPSRRRGWILRVRELSLRGSRAPFDIWDPISGPPRSAKGSQVFGNWNFQVQTIREQSGTFRRASPPSALSACSARLEDLRSGWKSLRGLAHLPLISMSLEGGQRGRAGARTYLSGGSTADLVSQEHVCLFRNDTVCKK